MLDGKTPDQVVAERLKARRKLANPKPHGRAGPGDILGARQIAEAAEEVSQPDSAAVAELGARAAGPDDRHPDPEGCDLLGNGLDEAPGPSAV